MARTTPETTRKTKKHPRELSLLSIFLRSFCALFVLSWVFVLGILVGRGYLPEGLKAFTELKAQIARLPEPREPEGSPDPDIGNEKEEDPKFAFYEKLSTKKDEVAKKNQPVAPKKQDAPKEVKQTTDLPELRGLYTIQLVSLENEGKAQEIINHLVDLGYPAYLHKMMLKGKTYFRVRCGKFSDEKEARDYHRKLTEKEGLHGFILKIGE